MKARKFAATLEDPQLRHNCVSKGSGVEKVGFIFSLYYWG